MDKLIIFSHVDVSIDYGGDDLVPLPDVFVTKIRLGFLYGYGLPFIHHGLLLFPPLDLSWDSVPDPDDKPILFEKADDLVSLSTTRFDNYPGVVSDVYQLFHCVSR